MGGGGGVLDSVCCLQKAQDLSFSFALWWDFFILDFSLVLFCFFGELIMALFFFFLNNLTICFYI